MIRPVSNGNLPVNGDFQRKKKRRERMVCPFGRGLGLQGDAEASEEERGVFVEACGLLADKTKEKTTCVRPGGPERVLAKKKLGEGLNVP